MTDRHFPLSIKGRNVRVSLRVLLMVRQLVEHADDVDAAEAGVAEFNFGNGRNLVSFKLVRNFSAMGEQDA